MKKLLCVGGLITGVALSMNAMAFCTVDKPLLTIINKTSSTATSKLNGKQCSTILGAIGTTQPYSQSTLTECQITSACLLNASDCTAEVHLADNCAGEGIGVVHLHVNLSNLQKTTVGEIHMADGTPYNITHDGLVVTLSEKTSAQK